MDAAQGKVPDRQEDQISGLSGQCQCSILVQAKKEGDATHWKVHACMHFHACRAPPEKKVNYLPLIKSVSLQVYLPTSVLWYAASTSNSTLHPSLTPPWLPTYLLALLSSTTITPSCTLLLSPSPSPAPFPPLRFCVPPALMLAARSLLRLQSFSKLQSLPIRNASRQPPITS